ncbi:hypothetical protein PM082_023507 [Marasmius tenuissimus]|nr:hypothetical protein PM082_023507 [Marasmius tenuissimus]
MTVGATSSLGYSILRPIETRTPFIERSRHSNAVGATKLAKERVSSFIDIYTMWSVSATTFKMKRSIRRAIELARFS